MIKRTIRGLIQLLGGLGAGLAIIMSLAAWRLSSGPIPLTFMSPYIQDVLSAAHPDFRIELDDTILTWGGWERALDIRVVNVRAIDQFEAVIATVPELSMSMSARALVQGFVAPKRIELFYPTLRLLRLRDGSLQIAFGEGDKGTSDLVPRMFAQLLAPPDPENAMSYLTRVDIIDADLTIEDQLLETSWRAPSAQLHIKRDQDGIVGNMRLNLDIEGHKAEVTAVGAYQLDNRRLDLGVDFVDLRPALFARLDPLLKPFAALDLPLRGRATVGLLADGTLESGAFDLRGAGGDLVLPAPAAQTIRIETLALKGQVDGTNDSLTVEDLVMNFGSGGKLHLPAPADHEMPLRTLRASGRYLLRGQRLDVSFLELDLQGPKFTLTGTADGVGAQAGTTLQAQATLEGVPVDEFGIYWPKAWGGDAHRWCVNHMSAGLIPRAEAQVALRMDGKGKTEIISLSGEMDILNAVVDYLPPMPKAVKASGKAHFNTQRFDIYLSHGEVNDLAIRKGTIFLTGLDQVDQFADIELFIEGPVRSAMNLIEHKPLEFASAVGIEPDKTAGMASTRLKLDFILENDLTVDQVDVSARASTRDTFISEAVLGRNVSKGNLELQVDKRGMDVSGDIELAGIPSQLKWRRNFGNKAPVISHYELTSRIDDVQDTKDLGFELRPFAGDIIRGAANTKIFYTEFRGGRGQVRATADLAELAIDLPMIGWYKDPGVGGMAEVGLSVQGGVVKDIDHFSIKARDMGITGSARYSPVGTGLERVDFSQISYGRTDMKGALIPNDDGSWTVTAHGASFDMAPLYGELFKGPARPVPDEGTGLQFTLSLDLDNVWLGEEQRMRDVVGTLSRRDDRWRSIRVEGRVSGDKPFSARILPGTGGNRTLDVKASDAGALLRALGVYENMIGGSLEVTGTIDDSRSNSPVSGDLTIKQYRIINAPVLAHLVSMAAITGILDSLEGEGLGFLRLDVPFHLSDGVIDVRDAKSSGVSLGFTASGTIYTAAEVVEMEGTVVPAYAINAVWGEIPILGELLTGGEKGGGVFAARYQMSGSLEDPQIKVDPLSALAPGFLRNLFDVFDEDEEKEEPEPTPPVEPESPFEPLREEQMPVGGL